MQFDAHCMECLVRRQLNLALKYGDGKTMDAYMREVMQTILTAPKGVSAPWLAGAFAGIFQRYWPGEDAYAKLKQDSNDLVMDMLPRLREAVDMAQDPLEMALRYACVGNFLDFGILAPETARQELDKSLEGEPDELADMAVWAKMRGELMGAKEVLILGDNAGEIVFDMLLVEQLKKHDPALTVTYCVRGGNVQNDATRQDATYCGMDKICAMVDSGANISGTELDYIGDELKAAIKRADVIIAKGSGNFESMAGCGLNVYYVFMCKCRRIAKLMKVPLMSAMLLRERDAVIADPYVGRLD
ncbi:MAG: DUF89 family protein [Clostridia bacterium]|nr:DUF89 family protein [Clostridia bacterium]